MKPMRITKGNPEIRVDRRRSEDDRVGEGYHAARRILASLAPTTPTSLTPPGYQLLDTLGVGGGGATFLALREGSDRPVALKVLHAHAAPGPARQRAWRELDLLQETHLPCLPRLLDYGVTGDRLFIATEFVSGQRLDEHARAAPASRDRWNQLAETLARVADAVHSLNERGIIHRDLKPSNILIASDGSPFIIDLGVAALAARDAAETLTADGVPIGTPAFMSPEQARGERDLFSIRSDVYALGATACAVLTGRTPHDLEGVSLHEAVRRVGSEPARDARTLEPDLPRPLAAIIAKACAAHPRERYATAAELAEDLRRFIRREPVLATRPGAWQRAVRWVGKHPVAATAILCAGMVAGTAGAAVAIVKWLAKTPMTIVVRDTSPQTAELLAFDGTTLHAWQSNQGFPIGFRSLISDGGWPTHGNRALLQLARTIPRDVEHVLICYDADHPTRELWRTPTRAPGIRLPEAAANWLRGDPDPTFRCTVVTTGNIMGDGAPEVVVALGHSQQSPTCVRVYDLNGRVLWQGWHHGQIDSMIWLEHERLLVCSGVSEDSVSSDLVTELGRQRASPVLFAIRVPGSPSADVAIVTSWTKMADRLVAWSRTMPASFADVVASTEVTSCPDGPICFSILSRHDRMPLATMSVDARGELVGEPKVAPQARVSLGRLQNEVCLIEPGSEDSGALAPMGDSLLRISGRPFSRSDLMMNPKLIAIPLSLLAVPALATTINDGLVGFFPFEGTPYDGMNHCYNIQTYGAPTYDRGAVGRAIRFDGVDDALAVDHNGELSFDMDTDSFSLAFYVKWDGGSGDRTVMQDRWGDNTSVSYSAGFNGSRDEFNCDSWYASSGTNYDVSTQKSPFVDQWRHVAITFDAGTGTKSMYVDGYLVDQATRPNQLYEDPNNTRITIGAYWGASGGLFNYFDGLLDDLRIYNRVLSESEINELVDLKPCPADTNLDGFVTGDDYDYFAEYFENGCP